MTTIWVNHSKNACRCFVDVKTHAWTRKENPSSRSFCFSMISSFLTLHILKDRWWQQQKAFISAEVLGNNSQKICFPKEDQTKQSQVCAHSSGEQFLQEEVSKPTLLPMALSWGLKNSFTPYSPPGWGLTLRPAWRQQQGMQSSDSGDSTRKGKYFTWLVGVRQLQVLSKCLLQFNGTAKSWTTEPL